MTPAVHQAGDVTSVLDAAREPETAARLAPFDSVLARSQSAGRGQFRRHWHSPAGNIYAALRLPQTAPFLGTEAAVALGAWIARALRDLGFPCLLKWPNDIVLAGAAADGGPGKVCGILLEERAGVLLAGIGINVASCPSQGDLRDGAAVGAASLGAWTRARGMEHPDCVELWKTLVNRVLSFYSQNSAPDLWRETATGLLLWRGETVVLEDGDLIARGSICGLGPGGELMLSSRGNIRQFLSGGIRRCEDSGRRNGKQNV